MKNRDQVYSKLYKKSYLNTNNFLNKCEYADMQATYADMSSVYADMRAANAIHTIAPKSEKDP